MSGYTQLTQEERYQIHILKRAGHTQSEIAEMLGRHKATISRELARNTGLSGYRPKQAQRLALTRRHAKRAAEWVRENVTAKTSPPTVSEGETIIHLP